MAFLKKLFFTSLLISIFHNNKPITASSDTQIYNSTTYIVNSPTDSFLNKNGFTNGLYFSDFNFAILLNNSNFNYTIFQNVQSVLVGSSQPIPGTTRFGTILDPVSSQPLVYFYGTETTTISIPKTIKRVSPISFPSTTSTVITIPTETSTALQAYSIGFKVESPNIAIIFDQKDKKFMLFNNIETLAIANTSIQDTNLIPFGISPNPSFNPSVAKEKQPYYKHIKYYGKAILAGVESLNLIQTKIKENLTVSNPAWYGYYFKTRDLVLILNKDNTFKAYSNISKKWLKKDIKTTIDSPIAYESNVSSNIDDTQNSWINIYGSPMKISPISILFSGSDPTILSCDQSCQTTTNNNCIPCPPVVAYNNATIINGLTENEDGFYEEILIGVPPNATTIKQAIILDKKTSTFKVYRGVVNLSLKKDPNQKSILRGFVNFGHKENPIYDATNTTSPALEHIEFWGQPYSITSK